MRLLIVSLIIVVLAAIFSVGWTLDQLFFQVSNNNGSDEIQLYKELGDSLAAVLNSPSEVDTVLGANTGSSLVEISLQQSQHFHLPDSMLEQFQSGQALVLESDNGVSINYNLPQLEQVLTITPTDFNRARQSSVGLIFTSVFYLLVLSILLLWLYPLIRRLGKLSAAARDFGQGQLSRRVNPKGISYISGIELEFNRMADRIQTLISDNKLLSSAVSHDLRTPLARLRFGIDVLAGTTEQSARDKYTQRLSGDIAQMESLVNSLLEFASFEHKLSDEVQATFSINKLVTDCAERFEQSELSIELYVRGEHVLDGNERQFSMLLDNLLSNAVKHAKKRVKISLQSQEKSTLLVVSDDGPGIELSQRRTVLMPFVRGDNNQTIKGHGLGLAIVNRIAQRHLGEVSIDSCPTLHGARVMIVFPKV